jgi:hypothetical protein
VGHKKTFQNFGTFSNVGHSQDRTNIAFLWPTGYIGQKSRIWARSVREKVEVLRTTEGIDGNHENNMKSFKQSM